MKKYKKLAYILFLVVIAVLSASIYANASKDNNNENQKEKAFSEIEFLEAKLLNLFNGMNNIEARNYDISVSEISQQTKDYNESSTNSSSKQGTQEGSGAGEEENSGSENSSSSNSSSDTKTQKSQKFNLETKGVLTNSNEIDWNNVKSEIEILYSSIPTITLDLYQSNINQEDILNFSKEFDNLTMAVKEEKKEDTLSELSKLYEYIPKFMQNSEKDEINKIVIETKSNILKAYSKLDSKNWEEISKDVKQAVEVYSKLLTNTNIETSKQYSVSKIYVMINELQNAVQIQDESIFLIKYKNIVEELNSIV